MSAIEPKAETIQKFLMTDDNGPVVMVNMLKFKPDGGAQSYATYGAAVGKMVEAVGGRVLYAGPVTQTLIGDESWDVVALVEYPSRSAFFSMITSAEYQKVHPFRAAGLERTELYATRPQQQAFGVIR